jgi:phosphatidylethanolamine/phosphatidyl-N-methylethanolamine N-methyltransferase
MLAGSHSFIRKFIRDPRETGAVAPATRNLANSVGKAAREAFHRHRQDMPDLHVLELGAGTGALTVPICPLNPVLIEKDQAWAALLRLRFPALEVRQECAINTLEGLARPAGVVSSIPLLNNPQSAELKRVLGAKYLEGLVKFCVLYSYGWFNPLADAGFREARRVAFVPRSLPPAHVWVFQ